MTNTIKPTIPMKSNTNGLRPADIRVSDEYKVLIQGALASIVIIALVFFAIVPMVMRLPQPANLLVLLVLAAWVLGPYAWLGYRAYQESARWKAALQTPLCFPDHPRQNPQRLTEQLCTVLGIANVPTVVMVPGRPQFLTLGSQLLITEDFYIQTTDRDLLTLLIHELGHHFVGHLPLLPLARALPAQNADEPVPAYLTFFLLPALPAMRALEDWALWADVSADRLVLLIKPDVNLGVLGIIKQMVLTSPDSEKRANLVRFLGAADGMVDRGDELLVSNELTGVLRNNPAIESRIENVRAWAASEGYTVAMARLREGVDAMSHEE